MTSSHYDVICESRTYGARNPRSNYDVIRYSAGHAQHYGRMLRTPYRV